MKISAILALVAALMLTACTPANRGASFSSIPGSGRDTGAAQRTTLENAAKPSPSGEPNEPKVRPGDVTPSDPVYGDENPGDFFVRPKNQAIHI